MALNLEKKSEVPGLAGKGFIPPVAPTLCKEKWVEAFRSAASFVFEAH